MTRSLAALVAAALLAGASIAEAAQEPEPPALAQARARYNDGDYEGALAAAASVRHLPDAADAAELVRARAFLELYRQQSRPDLLVQARAALVAVHATALSPRDRIDLLVGLGQSLYLDGDPGAAAEIFDSALATTSLLEAPDRVQVLDWWATAVDRDAQAQPADHRARTYQRLVDRMEDELRLDPGNPAANYWLAVAARGSGDIARAWRVAVAGWVRAALQPDSADRVRADLDRLVTDALIPERVRAHPAPERDQARADLAAEWEAVKKQWIAAP